jgi:hypothetical protein
MKLLMEAEQAKLYDLENGYYVTQEHCSWIHQGYRLMIRPMGNCYLPSIFIDYDNTTPNFKIQTASYGSVPPNEIKKVIEGFKIALDTIDIIKNNFMEGE